MLCYGRSEAMVWFTALSVGWLADSSDLRGHVHARLIGLDGEQGRYGVLLGATEPECRPLDLSTSAKGCGWEFIRFPSVFTSSQHVKSAR